MTDATYKRLKAIKDECNGDDDATVAAVAKEFGWTLRAAYIATEYLFRPENCN